MSQIESSAHTPFLCVREFYVNFWKLYYDSLVLYGGPLLVTLLKT